MPSPTRPQEFGYQGFIDLWLPNGGFPGIAGAGPVVADFKTSKNIKKYGLTTEGLLEDVQGQLYAVWAMFSTGARHIPLRWIYMATEGARRAEVREAEVTASHAADQFLEIDRTGNDIYELRKKAPDESNTNLFKEFGLSLEPNIEMCEQYGGCPYKSICNLSPSQFISSIVPESISGVSMASTVDLFANLKARKQAVAEAPAEAPVAFVRRDTIPAPDPEVLGINPPEKDLPLAPPVGAVAIPDLIIPAEKPKRGRPKKEAAPEVVEAAAEPAVEKTGAELCEEMIANANKSKAAAGPVAFEAAWAELGVAVKKFLSATK